MSERVTLSVYRYQDEDHIPGRALELHNLRADTLKEALQSESISVTDWGNTDDTEPHEVVEIAIMLLTPLIAHVAWEGVQFVGKKMAEKAIDESTSAFIKWIITKLRKPQEDKKIRDFQITLPSGVFINVDPPVNGEIKVMFSDGDVVSIIYRSG